MELDFQELGDFKLELNDITLDMAIDSVNDPVKEEIPVKKTRFGEPVDDGDLDKLISDTIPANTKKSTNWAKNVFMQWRSFRNTNNEIPELENMSVDDINKWLSRFIVEVGKQDGDFYPPKSLYLLATGILRYMRDCGKTINFMNEGDDRFIRFRKTLDSQMKQLTSQGYGATIKQAEPISAEQEDKLWDTKTIGFDSSESLLNGVFFYNCKLFGMRGRDEHHDLEISQFKLGSDENGKYINFIGRSNKTFKGGLRHRNVEHKNIKHYVSDSDNERSVMRLYESYLGHLNATEGKFYRRPCTGSLAFSKQNVGVNKLESMMKDMCKKAGIEGNFTNQSGKRTCATHMFQAGVDEQIIMSRTGHCSVQGVRKYKRPSDTQLKDISNILQPPKRIKIEAKEMSETNLDIMNSASEVETNVKLNENFAQCNVVNPARENETDIVNQKENVLSEMYESFPFSGFTNCSFNFNFHK